VSISFFVQLYSSLFPNLDLCRLPSIPQPLSCFLLPKKMLVTDSRSRANRPLRADVKDEESPPETVGGGQEPVPPLDSRKSSTAVEKLPPKMPALPYSAFSASRRRIILALVTVAGFFGPLAANIYLPTLPVLSTDFGASITEINATVTVFMAVFAFAVSYHGTNPSDLDKTDSDRNRQPLIWSSFADWKGRRPLYIISLSIFILANVLLAAVPGNYGALIFLRIVQAIGSAAVVSLGAGTVADVSRTSTAALK
jgi:hypothetical protein